MSDAVSVSRSADSQLRSLSGTVCYPDHVFFIFGIEVCAHIDHICRHLICPRSWHETQS